MNAGGKYCGNFAEKANGMKNVCISVIKQDVLDEIGRTTAYIGQRKPENADKAYGRISTTEADNAVIERYWQEASDLMIRKLDRFVVSVSKDSNFVLKLGVSDRYDDTLTYSVATSAYSFFVNYIISKWCELTDAENVAVYAGNAARRLADVSAKIYFKKRPERASIKEEQQHE